MLATRATGILAATTGMTSRGPPISWRREPASTPLTVPPLVMENGLGGFTRDGREYVVVLDGERETPLPWSNVLANPAFGTIVSSSGSAFTWAVNSRENRLTPFANDPVERSDRRKPFTCGTMILAPCGEPHRDRCRGERMLAAG